MTPGRGNAGAAARRACGLSEMTFVAVSGSMTAGQVREYEPVSAPKVCQSRSSALALPLTVLLKRAKCDERQRSARRLFLCFDVYQLQAVVASLQRALHVRVDVVKSTSAIWSPRASPRRRPEREGYGVQRLERSAARNWLAWSGSRAGLPTRHVRTIDQAHRVRAIRPQ